ncbi:MAG: hypothetical protein Q4A54_02195 [Parabacteroides sp.]|nr:hypothetical protein [Parabacteroides sp.]MDO4755124.1 hypothetical protein [Parabacteroides sp.]
MNSQSLEQSLENTLIILNTRPITSEYIVKIAVNVMERIRYDSEDKHWDKIDKIFDTLLKMGLDLNETIDDNIFSDCIWIENDTISVMLLKKFLEHGADPNLVATIDQESLYEYVNFAIGYDMFGVDNFMYIWLLLIAYGGRNKNGNTELNMLNGFTYEIFKDIERYGFCIEEKPSGHHMMYFFDKETKKIVATYKKHWHIS